MYIYSIAIFSSPIGKSIITNIVLTYTTCRLLVVPAIIGRQGRTLFGTPLKFTFENLKIIFIFFQLSFKCYVYM